MDNLAVNPKTQESAVFVVGQSAWHQKGYRFDNALTAEQAVEKAGLDYQVALESVELPSGASSDYFQAVVRQDTKSILGVVGPRYTPIQNDKAFTFFDELVSRDEAVYHSGGVLGLGEKVWIQAKMPEYIRVGKDDLTEMYVTLTNSHDGLGSMKALITPIRVVCQNTLRAALKDNKGVVSIRHTVSAEDRIKEAASLLDITSKYTSAMQDVFNAMAKKKISKTGVDDFLATFFPSDKEEISTRTQGRRDAFLNTLEYGVGQQEIKQMSAWKLYNGYTRHLEDNLTMNEYAIDNLLEGNLHSKRQDAFNYAMALVK